MTPHNQFPDLLTAARDADLSLTVSWAITEPPPPIVYALNAAYTRGEPIFLHVGGLPASELQILDASQPLAGAQTSLTVRLREVIPE